MIKAFPPMSLISVKSLLAWLLLIFKQLFFPLRSSKHDLMVLCICKEHIVNQDLFFKKRINKKEIEIVGN